MIEQLMMRSERWMYAEGRPNGLANVLNGAWARAARAGIWRSRLVTLEVRGRVSGRTVACPLIVARVGGERYLVSMLGERASWVQNVRAAGGRAVLRWGTREDVRLEEVPAAERAAIIKRHLEVAPAARSFVPVDRHADLAEFGRIAQEIPVFRVLAAPAVEPVKEAGSAEPAATERSTATGRRPRRRRRWLLWIAVALGAVVLITFASIGTYLKASDPPLALPRNVAAPAGALDGAWRAGGGSTAGFRVEQTVLGMTGEVVGRTTAVTGSMSISSGRVTAGSFQLDMTQIRANGKRSPQFDTTLATATYPTAIFELTGPIETTEGFASGAVLRTTAAGTLTLHGLTRPVSAAVSARRDGTAVEVLGQIPIRLADWGIATPAGYGWLGSLADHGVAEFLIVLHR